MAIRRLIKIRGVRFLMAGGINTLVTYLLYLILAQVAGYQLAYFCAYVLGILLSYTLNARFVFRVGFSWTGMFSFPAVYLFQYLISALLLGLLVKFLGIHVYVAPILVIICVLPLTYVLTKTVLDRGALHKLP